MMSLLGTIAMGAGLGDAVRIEMGLYCGCWFPLDKLGVSIVGVGVLL